MNKDNQPVLGFWSYSNGFLIGEYFPKVDTQRNLALN